MGAETRTAPSPARRGANPITPLVGTDGSVRRGDRRGRGQPGCGALDEAAVSEYRRCFDAATIHAGCEDYRAGATIDLSHDRADRKRIHCPVLVLWSARGIGASYDVRSIWQQQAEVVQGRALDCGHFLAEERPAETTSELTHFLEQL